jgi:flagellar motor switch protein FliN/FliY
LADENEGLLNQSEIEALFGALNQGGGAPAPPPKPASSPPPASPIAPTKAGPSMAPPPPPPDASVFQVQPFGLQELQGNPSGGNAPGDIALIADVDLNVRVELGRSRMYIEDVLKLREGAIVPLEKLAGDPVDIYVNGQLLARGEVLVLNDNFCVRVSSIVGERDQERAEAS